MTSDRGRTFLAVALSVIAFFIVCLDRSARALPRGKSTSRPQSVTAPQSTRLKASAPVVLYSRKRGHQTIEHLNVTVSNVGLGLATHVYVFAEFPDGISYALKGPGRIVAGQRCLYSLGGKKTVLRGGIPKIVVSCGSCSRE